MTNKEATEGQRDAKAWLTSHTATQIQELREFIQHQGGSLLLTQDAEQRLTRLQVAQRLRDLGEVSTSRKFDDPTYGQDWISAFLALDSS